MKNVSDYLDSLNKDYKLLMNKFPRSVEAVYLYSTFLLNLMLDSEKSMIFINKKHSLEKTKFTHQKTLSYFDDENGIMIISCDCETLGEIRFMNTKVTMLLGYSESIVGSHISSIIPPPYDRYLTNHLFKYINSVKDSKIHIPNNIFVMTRNGYLKEFKVKAALVVSENSIYLAVLLKERPETHRVALVSESGDIYGVSESFESLLGTSKTDIISMNFRNLFPEIKYINLKAHFPYMVYKNDMIFALILCYTEFEAYKIHYILLSDDPREIKA